MMLEVILLVLLALLGAFFVAATIKDPESAAQIETIKTVINLLLQSGYSPQKIIEIIHLYN